MTSDQMERAQLRSGEIGMLIAGARRIH